MFIKLLKYRQYKKLLSMQRTFEKIINNFNLKTDELNKLFDELKLQNKSLEIAKEKNNLVLVKEYQNLIDNTKKIYNKKKDFIYQLYNIIESSKKIINELIEKFENTYSKTNLSEVVTDIKKMQNKITEINNIEVLSNDYDEKIETLQNNLKEEYKKLEIRKSVKKDLFDSGIDMKN